MPPMMQPHMMPPPPPPMASPIQSYPVQQPYYGTLESMPHYPVERMGMVVPPPPPHFLFKPESEPGMMAMSTNQAHHHMLPPPPAFKAPFQLLKNSGDEQFKLRLKPNAEIYDKEQLYSSINDEEQDSDMINNEDYSKDYNAAPKISMPKYQQRN
ncbi:hypothetical protein BLA29_012913 [Euroglyphus maynei]|uniref:Uncharacterized protein n=1 Tax=Euroglyphus maynei TaxID=6958 RepID=A0A1Y3BS84_EURMA|nr:hypothetical protein BLA29_012913 [Euroglyphus maynei]